MPFPVCLKNLEKRKPTQAESKAVWCWVRIPVNPTKETDVMTTGIPL
jgi:hypothetical protein